MADKERQDQLQFPDPGESEEQHDPEEETEGEPSEEEPGGCEEEQPAKKGGKQRVSARTVTVERPTPAKQPAPAPAKPAAPAAPTFTYPFWIRYATQMVDLTGFVDGQQYTAEQIKDVLVQNGYVEFQEMEPDFARHEATNTLVITIKGSRKGGGHGA